MATGSEADMEMEASTLGSFNPGVVTHTITFSHTVENFNGAEEEGTGKTTGGLSKEDMEGVQARLGARGIASDLINLKDLIPDYIPEKKSTEYASVLVVDKFVQQVLGISAAQKIFEEVEGLECDTKAWNPRLGVHERKARQNLCFTDTTKKGEVEKKIGSSVAFEDIPSVALLRAEVEKLFEGFEGVWAELNRYHRDGAGIGWHGDKERAEVVAVRFGRARAFKYAWWGRFNDPEGNGHTGRISPIWKRMMQHGTLYIMSKKAVGRDWSLTKDHVHGCRLLTLRHAAGDDEYAGDKKTKFLDLDPKTCTVMNQKKKVKATPPKIKAQKRKRDE